MSNEFILVPAAMPTRLQRNTLRLMALFGWRVTFKPLPGPRGVAIFYPHTSNWDVVFGLGAKVAIGIPFRWLGKEALFRGVSGLLLAPILRRLGCEPIDRKAATGAIERLAKRIQLDEYWLALSPEGTRKYTDYLRSGFYYIALTAKVPLGLAYVDYANREVGMVDYITLTGDVEADLARIREIYRHRRGREPKKAGRIALRPNK
jgi:1-acyl-sn-glycerol-3-phosphate acyltransferase